MSAFGRMSNFSATYFASLASSSLPVPKVSTYTPTGRATPMAYAICTSARRASPEATMFFAT